MGHMTVSKDSLVPLIDRLNKYPIGLVDNEILREILSLLFDEREAFVASKFPLEETTIAELSPLTGMSADELLPLLNSMADKGIVMDFPFKGTTFYLLMPGLIGFFEFTFMKRRVDLPMEKIAELMHQYLEGDFENGQANEFFGSKVQRTRSLMYEEHIPVTSVITPYESAKSIIENSKFGAVSMCYCRHKKEHQGKKCKKNAPMEGICISLGTGARFLARRGFAEEKSKSELLEILETAKSLNLTHVTDNVRNRPSFVCNCCSCCCELMAGVQAGYYKGIAKTSYIAGIDPDKCEYCGDCFMACNVKAIALAKSDTPVARADRFAAVDTERCLGCGACVSSCDKEAIAMSLRDDYIIPPKNAREMYTSVLKEKGRIRPYITGRIKKAVKKTLRIK